MNFAEYQEQAVSTAIYTNEFYPFASLMIEAAEFSDLVAKPLLRGDKTEVDIEEMISEAGDVLWNLAAALDEFNISLDTVARYNLDKLASRKARGVLQGSGGDR